jgi:hypothetical protein
LESSIVAAIQEGAQKGDPAAKEFVRWWSVEDPGTLREQAAREVNEYLTAVAEFCKGKW